MKYLIYILLVSQIIFTQDNNYDGTFDAANQLIVNDLNGDGIFDNKIPGQFLINKFNIPSYNNTNSLLSFTQLWQSPSGAFTNCWDGYIGYIDSDTLLDIAGFTFSPAKFYIWEQSAIKPDSFYLVTEFIKSEGGSFGPIIVGDTDGDGKKEIIAADVLGIARIYIYENDGDNIYINQNTQTTLVHPSNSQGGQGIYIADLNKNGKKEIILLRGTSSPGGGEVRVWEHTGSFGNPTYTNIYTYTTVTYIFGKGGIGDSDNDGWDEVFLTFGGFPTFNTFIRRIEFDSSSSSFQHLIFEAPSIGLPASYRVYDLGNDNVKELLMTGNSNSRASVYIFRSNGQNSYVKLDSIFEYADNNNMLNSDIKVLTGNTNPTLLLGSFNGRVYTYQHNGAAFVKDYENLNFPGAAIRRVYWLPTTSYDGYFNTWSSTNSNGTFYVFKRDNLIGIINNHTPVGFELYQNYPNPFNPVTHLKFEISELRFVRLTVYDILGNEINILVNQKLKPGIHEFLWDGTKYSSGVYFYKLEADNPSSSLRVSETKKMLMIK
ncbi:MAG TPA: FG-GAP-like repeat-containing protein [Ignavibacteria bacterium]|nr:FG-GAP-like repeat-containing protein [Ignavibacteria bacterium]